MNKPVTDIPHPKMLLDPYVTWAAKEGVPITEDFGVDLLTVPDRALAALRRRRRDRPPQGPRRLRLDLRARSRARRARPRRRSICSRRSSTCSPATAAPPSRRATAASTASNGARRACSRCRSTPATSTSIRAAASARGSPRPTISALMLNLFHNETLRLRQRLRIPRAAGRGRSHFSGEGEFIPVRPGRNMWETNFIPDLAGFELKTGSERGAGGSNMMFILADGTMHAHTSQMPVGTYKKAHRHGADFHVFAVTGHGYLAALVRGRKGLRARRLAARRGCSRRPTRCSTSTSTPRPIRRAISRSPSAACAIRSPPTSAACSWAWT